MEPLIGTQLLMVKLGVNKMKKLRKLFILPLLALSLFNVNNTQLTNSQFQLEETTNDENIVGIRKEIPSTSNNDVKVSNILKVQASNVENGKRSLRFVAGISSLSLKAHFHREEIKVNDEVIMIANDIEVTCAYSKILNGTAEQTASDVFKNNEYNYFVAYTLKDIPEEYWFAEINISLFVNQEKKTYRNANVYGALDNFSDTFAYSDDHKAVGLNSNIANTIESVNIPQYYYEITNDDYNLVADKNNKTQIEEVGRLTFYGGKSFNFNSTSLKHIVFPNQIKKIGDNTFYNCNKIEKIVLPSTLETIGNHSFYNCVNLKEIIIPESVKNIGSYVFMECYSLEKIVFSSEAAVRSEGLFGLHDTKLKVYDRCSNVSKLNSNWYYSAKQYYVYSETTRIASQEDISNGINGYWHYENNEPVIWEISTVESK